eukprot:15478145-Alexandrium_andersonii.AAC.1
MERPASSGALQAEAGSRRGRRRTRSSASQCWGPPSRCKGLANLRAPEVRQKGGERRGRLSRRA